MQRSLQSALRFNFWMTWARLSIPPKRNAAVELFDNLMKTVTPHMPDGVTEEDVDNDFNDGAAFVKRTVRLVTKLCQTSEVAGHWL